MKKTAGLAVLLALGSAVAHAQQGPASRPGTTPPPRVVTIVEEDDDVRPQVAEQEGEAAESEREPPSAAIGLWKRRTPPGERTLTRLLEHDDERVRFYAAFQLGDVASLDARRMEALAGVLRERSGDEAAAAALGLARAGARAIPAIMESDGGDAAAIVIVLGDVPADEWLRLVTDDEERRGLVSVLGLRRTLEPATVRAALSDPALVDLGLRLALAAPPQDAETLARLEAIARDASGEPFAPPRTMRVTQLNSEVVRETPDPFTHGRLEINPVHTRSYAALCALERAGAAGAAVRARLLGDSSDPALQARVLLTAPSPDAAALRAFDRFVRGAPSPVRDAALRRLGMEQDTLPQDASSPLCRGLAWRGIGAATPPPHAPAPDAGALEARRALMQTLAPTLAESAAAKERRAWAALAAHDAQEAAIALQQLAQRIATARGDARDHLLRAFNLVVRFSDDPIAIDDAALRIFLQAARAVEANDPDSRSRLAMHLDALRSLSLTDAQQIAVARAGLDSGFIESVEGAMRWARESVRAGEGLVRALANAPAAKDQFRAAFYREIDDGRLAGAFAEIASDPNARVQVRADAGEALLGGYNDTPAWRAAMSAVAQNAVDAQVRALARDALQDDDALARLLVARRKATALTFVLMKHPGAQVSLDDIRAVAQDREFRAHPLLAVFAARRAPPGSEEQAALLQITARSVALEPAEFRRYAGLDAAALGALLVRMNDAGLLENSHRDLILIAAEGLPPDDPLRSKLALATLEFANRDGIAFASPRDARFARALLDAWDGAGRVFGEPLDIARLAAERADIRAYLEAHSFHEKAAAEALAATTPDLLFESRAEFDLYTENVVQGRLRRLSREIGERLEEGRKPLPPLWLPDENVLDAISAADSGDFLNAVDYRSVLPTMPWPPPAGYEPTRVDPALIVERSRSLGDIADRLQFALQAADPNYRFGFFDGPPNGFAIVARIERVERDGKPVDGARWASEGPAPASLRDLLGDLFFQRPGYFRTLVFVVTDETGFRPTSLVTRLPTPREGALDLPRELRDAPIEGRQVYALVYGYIRRPGGRLAPWLDDEAPTALVHLRASGVLAAMRAAAGVR